MERDRITVYGNEKMQMGQNSFYRRARINGLWNKILKYVVKKTRINAGRKESPSYAIIDSQSVKTTLASEERGIDGGKKQKEENDILW